MKDKLFKKRNYVDWVLVMNEIEDCLVYEQYDCIFCSSHISSNRIAYLALRSVFGKAKLDYYRATRDLKIFTL